MIARGKPLLYPSAGVKLSNALYCILCNVFAGVLTAGKLYPIAGVEICHIATSYWWGYMPIVPTMKAILLLLVRIAGVLATSLPVIAFQTPSVLCGSLACLLAIVVCVNLPNSCN